MTFLVNFHIGGTSISAHGIFEFAGVFVAFRYYLFLKKQQPDHISINKRLAIVIAATFGAVLGSRIVGSLENLPQWLQSPHPWLYFWTNKTLAGGLLGGLASVEFIKRIIKERQNSGDLFVYPLLLGMIIGRIGCFSAGIYEETYGLPSSLPWAMNLGDGIPRHPVTLYEILFLSVLWFVLRKAQKNLPLSRGSLFKLFLIAYLVFRLLLDFIKPGWRYFLGMGTIQLFCLSGLVYYFKYIVHPAALLDTTNKHAT